MASQAALLHDQLESDRTRQFQEFLDDRVKTSLSIGADDVGNLCRCYQEHVGQKTEAYNSIAR